MKDPATPSIFRYIDPVRYLNDAFTRLHSSDVKFTIRSWAKLIGFKTSTQLNQILKGHRSVPAVEATQIAKSLGLAPLERKYFEALAGIGRAQGARDQELWMGRAQKIYESVSFELEVIENLRFFDNPLLTAILALVEQPDFKCDSRWIQQRLTQEASTKKVRESLDFLLTQGFLAPDSSGRMIRTRNHLWSRQKRLNETALAYAARAVYFKSLENREFYKKDRVRAKKAIQTFTTNLLRQLGEKSDDSNEASA